MIAKTTLPGKKRHIETNSLALWKREKAGLD